MESDACCAEAAARQQGAVSLAQATACGLDREAVHRRLRANLWRRVLPRTYVLNGSPPSWERQLWAALLWVGHGSAVSGPAAAAVWGFPGFPRGPVEISHRGARQSRDGIVVRRVRLHLVDVTTVRGIPVTTAARTLSDIARHASASGFDIALHHCLHQGLVTRLALEEVAARRSGPGFAGAARFNAALAAYSSGPPPASPLETLVARRLGRSSLPASERQHEVRIGRTRRYLDFAWPASRVGLEVDGYRWHSSRSSWETDRRRLSDLRRAGWRIVQITHEDVKERFDEVVDELATLLR